MRLQTCLQLQVFFFENQSFWTVGVFIVCFRNANKPLNLWTGPAALSRALRKVQTISELAEGELRGKKAVICMIRPYGIYIEFQIRIFQGTLIFVGVSEIFRVHTIFRGFPKNLPLNRYIAWWTQNKSTNRDFPWWQ